jgi:hypothetical protein
MRKLNSNLKEVVFGIISVLVVVTAITIAYKFI